MPEVQWKRSALQATASSPPALLLSTGHMLPLVVPGSCWPSQGVALRSAAPKDAPQQQRPGQQPSQQKQTPVLARQRKLGIRLRTMQATGVFPAGEEVITIFPNFSATLLQANHIIIADLA